MFLGFCVIMIGLAILWIVVLVVIVLGLGWRRLVLSSLLDNDSVDVEVVFREGVESGFQEAMDGLRSLFEEEDRDRDWSVEQREFISWFRKRCEREFGVSFRSDPSVV
jgi:hypothetical protein